VSKEINVSLGGLSWTIKRGRLGTYLALQKANAAITGACRDRSNGEVAGGLFYFLKIVIADFDRGHFNQCPWYEIIKAYQEVNELNKFEDKDKFALFRVGDPSPSKPVAWDHDERAIILWIHLIADAYKWSKAEIENLWPEEAAALLQEILADDQERREFSYSLSEMAYHYDNNTKKSKFRPLPRPLWMVGGTDKKLHKIKKSLLPIGNVIYPESDKRFAEDKE